MQFCCLKCAGQSSQSIGHARQLGPLSCNKRHCRAYVVAQFVQSELPKFTVQFSILVQRFRYISFVIVHRSTNIKGTVPRDFRLHVFLCISFYQALEYPNRPILNFFLKIRRDICSSRRTTGVVDPGGK